MAERIKGNRVLLLALWRTAKKCNHNFKFGRLCYYNVFTQPMKGDLNANGIKTLNMNYHSIVSNIFFKT